MKLLQSLVLMLVLFVSQAVGAQVPWGQLPNVDQGRVTDTVKQRSEALMKKANCYFECPDTVYACVTAPHASRTALRMAGVIVRMVYDQVKDEEITRELENRARSAHPFKAEKIDLADTPRLGPENAAVKVVIFADFDCPYCHVVSPRLKKLIAGFRGQVALYFKLFPVKAHGPSAVVTCQAGEAAFHQGKFWELHDLMYENFEDHSDADVEQMARKLGLDMERFTAEWKSKDTRKRVRASKRQGVKLGVQATPTIFINGKRYYGSRKGADMKDRIEEELDLVTGKTGA